MTHGRKGNGMTRTKFDVTELSVCQVCIHLLANGEYNDGEDTAERVTAGIERMWGDDARHLSPGDGDLGFCTSACDMCGDDHHGDRFAAVALIPVDVERVSTWADGFGVWHAKVTTPKAGYAPLYVAQHAARIRARARRAIRAEVSQRESVSLNWRCRVAVAETDVDPDSGVTRSITFREMVG